MRNPFRGLRFSLLDFHSVRANLGMKIAMLGIALIPLIYGALYLMAFYDPYGSLDTLPVAVVNEDVAARTANGEVVTAGDDLVRELRSSDSLEYHFVDSREEAQKGLESGTYYNIIVIPKDFSSSVASADSDSPHQARLVMVANEANNYLSSILGASVMRVVTAKTNYAIGENYYVQIFDSIDETGESLKVASDGATELSNGLGDALDGSQAITDGLADAADGSVELGEGLVAAKDGSTQVTDGIASARDGASQLADGTVVAAAGSQTITDNLRRATQGADALDGGLQQLVSGLSDGTVKSGELAAGLHQLQEQGSSQLASGANGLLAALDATGGDLQALDTGAQQVAAGTQQMSDALGGLGGSVAAMAGQVDGLQGQLDDLEQQAASLAETLATSGEQLQTDATSASADAGVVKDALLSMPGKLSDATGAAQSASDYAVQAGDASVSAKGYADQAASEAQGISQTLESLSANEDGTYTIDAATLATLKQQASGAAQAAGAASQYADGAYQAAGAAQQYASGVKTGLDEATSNLAGMDGQIATLASDLTAVGDDLASIQQAAVSLSKIGDASQSLIDSSKETIGGAQQLVAGLAGNLSQVQALALGAQQVSDGVTAVVHNLTSDESNDGSMTLHAAAKALASGATQVDQSMLTAAAGADGLTEKGWKAALAGAQSAETGSSQLADGLSQLSDGSLALSTGLDSAKSGAAALRDGLGRLYAGSSTLTVGLGNASTGTATLADGLGRLYDGSHRLTDGLTTAQDGSQDLANGLSDGVEKVTEATGDIDEKAAMMSEPVEFEQQNYTSVANYGSGFAPYFIALGLWVGSLVMTFLLKPLNRRLLMSGANPVVAAFDGLVPWVLVGVVQSVLLGATIQFACGIQVDHPLAYYLLIVLSSVVFCAMIQAITAVFGFPGKFVAVVLLMLQLTTAAGTFPIETEFKVFQDLSPWLPMTYVVRALRQAMRGVDLSLVAPCVAALVSFAIISFGVTCLAAARRRTVTMMDLHPLVDL